MVIILNIILIKINKITNYYKYFEIFNKFFIKMFELFFMFFCFIIKSNFNNSKIYFLLNKYSTLSETAGKIQNEEDEINFDEKSFILEFINSLKNHFDDDNVSLKWGNCNLEFEFKNIINNKCYNFSDKKPHPIFFTKYGCIEFKFDDVVLKLENDSIIKITYGSKTWIIKCLANHKKFIDGIWRYFVENIQISDDNIIIYPTLVDFDAPFYTSLIQPLSNKWTNDIKRSVRLIYRNLPLIHCQDNFVQFFELKNELGKNIYNCIYPYKYVINQIRSEDENFIENFFISSKYGNGIDINFENPVKIQPCGINFVKISLHKSFHMSPNVFGLRSSALAKGIKIANISSDNDKFVICLQNTSNEIFSSKRFLVLNLASYINPILDIFYLYWINVSDLGTIKELDGNLKTIPIEYNDLERKPKKLD